MTKLTDDARSLLPLKPAGSPVSAAQNRAIEDAILTRARQLRIAAANRGSRQDSEERELEFLVPGTVATY
jgi:hypothetical protein